MEITKITTPGAGVRPELVIKPGKRLRNWHRRECDGMTLRQFARVLLMSHLPTDGRHRIARRWLDSKGDRL